MIPSTLILTSLLAFATAAPNPAVTEIYFNQVLPEKSTCHCQTISDQIYSVNLFIINKTTEEKGQLSQGFRDNFGVFCKGYRAQWDELVPIGTNEANGDVEPAFDAPSTLGANFTMAGGDFSVSGYALAFDLEQHQYDGCLTAVIKQAENQDVLCQCPDFEPSD